MIYTVENEENNQDGINFIDVTNPRTEIPAFLDFNEVLKHSLKIGSITSENNIKSLCDGGDHVEPYFSEESAATECELYLDNTTFEVSDKEGGYIEKTLEFDPEITNYEMF